MENRALLAFALSLAILIGYQMLFPPPEQRAPQFEAPQPAALPEQAGAPTQHTREAAPAATAQATAPNAWERPLGQEEATVEVGTDLYHAVLTSFGGRLKSFELASYRTSLDEGSEPLDMVASDSLLPLGATWTAQDGSVRDDRQVAYEISAGGEVSGASTKVITLRGVAAGGERITKTLTVAGDSYVLGYSVEVEGAAGPLGVSWVRRLDAESSGRWVVEGPTGVIDGKLESVNATDLEEPTVFSGTVAWAGYADHYFLAAYYPEQATQLRLAAAASPDLCEATLWDDAAGGSASYSLFIGPKSIHLLESLEHELGSAVDLGWFSIVARPLLEIMLFCETFTGNYGWAILLLTIGIRIVFYPVNHKQMEAMKGMQRIQPEMKRIQEKFKDDRERLNKEMMELYKRHKVNPLSGCLPMLLQLPVFIGLYNVLMQAIELRHAPFIGWITDLSQPDRLGGLAIPFVDPPGIPVMTLLMGGSMLLQQRMTPATGDPAQQRMMMFMPLIFTVMFVNFASGLVLYWLANNVLQILQQYLANRNKAKPKA